MPEPPYDAHGGRGYAAEFARSGVAPLPYPLQYAAANDLFREARERDDARFLPMWAGQSAGTIHDIPGAGEVVALLVKEAIAVLRQRIPAMLGER